MKLVLVIFHEAYRERIRHDGGGGPEARAA